MTNRQMLCQFHLYVHRVMFDHNYERTMMTKFNFKKNRQSASQRQLKQATQCELII